MATVTPRPTHNLEQDRSRIRSPLARLRKYIHAYVSLEGLALVGLFLAAWFWLGLLLDYGSFKVFLLDWVQELPWGVRLTLLLVMALAVVAIVSTAVLTRLFVDFSDAAVALVLERRFPAKLGDRLITAVELSDPAAAAAIGYSADMVRETIREAAVRVDEVPVKEVFDWKRLIMRAVVFLGLTVVLYAAVGGLFVAARAVAGDGPASAGFGDLNEASTIWAERNLLLRNTIWPRRAYLEVLDYPDELRIPRASIPPTLRVRAWKYVVSDPDAREGWRLLSWKDLQDRPELAGEVPALPADWAARDADRGMTVDEVEQALDAFPVRTSLPGGQLPARWAIASDQEASGWRPLMWRDLKAKTLGTAVPALSGDWDPKGMPTLVASGALLLGGPGSVAAAARVAGGPQYIDMSVDEVERAAADKKGPQAQAVRAVFARLDKLAAVREALDRIDERADDRAMRRVMRRLTVPTSATLVFKSNRASNTATLSRVAGNEYTGNFGELKDSVTFTVRAEDYVTPRKTITVVDRPRLERLESEEERPAYLYYRPAKDGSPLEIRGKRQAFQGVSMSVSGDATTIEVPSGTHMTLTGTVTKPITEATVFVDPKDAGHFVGGKVERLDDGVSFRMKLPDVRREQRFTFRFTDDDGVRAERKVLITPVEDAGPRVREFRPDEVIRQGKDGYQVAVGCRIPFNGKVRDDQGLARVRYACRVVPDEFRRNQDVRALDGVAAVPLLATGWQARVMGAAYLAGVAGQLARAESGEATAEQYIDLPAFTRAVDGRRLSDRRPEALERGTVLSLLGQKQKAPYRKLFNDFSILPDRWTDNDEDPDKPNTWVLAQDQKAPLACDLPLWQLTYRDRPLRDPDESKTQKRYHIEVRLVAEDTYLEGEIDKATKLPVPNTSASGETFTFVVMPENELLSNIAVEEEKRRDELDKATEALRKKQGAVRDMAFNLTAGGVQANDVNTFIARCGELDDALRTSHQDARAVSQAYERILREMRCNQLRPDIIAKVYKTIAAPLARVSESQFDATLRSVLEVRKALETPGVSPADAASAAGPKAGKARGELKKLVDDLQKILSAMQGLADINKLIKELARIEQQEAELEAAAIRAQKEALKQALRED
jgi:hypothetical protein